MTTAEHWLPVPNYEGLYEVSDHGRVRSLDRVVQRGGHLMRLRGKLMVAYSDERGYLRITLSREGEPHHWLVHQLVLRAFIGPPPEDQEGCHGPAGNGDNHLENLRWDTHSENALDEVRNGKHYLVNRDVCQLEHLLIAPNLKPSKLARGMRQCWACARAGDNQKYAISKGRPFDFRVVADAHYARIMEGAA